MKLIRLEILNLASLDKTGGETIDFEKGALGNSNIFSIVGPTGSGKSTLLDAICLALYNRAPRYPRKKGDRNQNIEIYGAEQEGERNRLAPTDARNILTRGKKAGYSKLTFLANNGNVYRAEWHVRFKTRTYDAPQTCLYILNKEGDGDITESEADWEQLPQIIGLDYEQFLRTVLIAQGSFAGFLTAKEDERYRLLEKLVGCEELYQGIADRIKQRKDAATDDYKQIAANWSVYDRDIIPDADLDTLKERILQLEEAEKKAKAELAKVCEGLTWYVQEEKLTADIGNYQRAHDAAVQRLAGMKPEADRLSLHDSTLEAVNLFKDIKTCEASMADREAELKKLEARAQAQEQAIKTQQQNLDTLQREAAAAVAELERQKPHINKAREIKALLQSAARTAREKSRAKADADKALLQAHEAVKKNAADIAEARRLSDKVTRELEELTATIDAQTKLRQAQVTAATSIYDVQSRKLEGKDIASLQDAKTAAEKKSNDLTNAIRIQSSLREKRQSQKTSEEMRNQLQKSNEEIDRQLQTFNLEALKTELDTIRASYTLMTSDNWQEHRTHLEDGAPCPLCGATTHPYRSTEVVLPVVNRMKALIDEKQSTLDKETDRHTRLVQERSRNLGTLNTLEPTLAAIRSEIDRLCKEWAVLHSSYPDWQADADSLRALQADLNAERDRATSALADYNALVLAVNKRRSEKEKAEKALADYSRESALRKEKSEKSKNDANTRLATESGKTDNLLRQEQEKSTTLLAASAELEAAGKEIAEHQAALRVEIGDADPDTLEAQLTSSQKNADVRAKAKSEEIHQMQGTLQVILGKMETTRQSRQSAEALRATTASALTDWLTTYNEGSQHAEKLSSDDIARLYSSTDDWEDLRSRLEACNFAVVSTRTTLQNAVQARNEHQQLPSRPEADKEALSLRKQQLESLSNAELVGAKVRLQKHDDAKRQMGSMYGQLKAAETLKQEWEDIVRAIGSDGSQLRKIAQCYTLRFLIEHANDEIRKFNSRYELQQVRNSLGIRVIDHDRADDVRDTTSLSGGETFIVSLGLALGLSSLSSRNISFENLFIDEGFGTLDPDTLATVIDSLAMLQSSQGKKVGVISHTDTMSERITTQIRVIKKGNGSSEIKIYPEY